MKNLLKVFKLIFVVILTLGIYTSVSYGAEAVPPTIQSQPKSKRAQIGSSVQFNVQASGDDLKYQWQYKRINGSWTDATTSEGSNPQTNTFTITSARLEQSNWQYRCLVSDNTYSGDKSIPTNTVTLQVSNIKAQNIKYVANETNNISITKQPTSKKVNVGDKAVFSVSVQGENLKYQWQYKSENGTWTNATANEGSNPQTNTLTIYSARTEQNNWQYRCLIKSEASYEDAITSTSALLQVTREGKISVKYLNEQYSITNNPSSVKAFSGDDVIFKVETSGDLVLTYRWLYKPNAQNATWTFVTDDMGTGMTTDTLTIKNAGVQYNGYQFRCSVGGANYKYEESKFSKVAMLAVSPTEQKLNIHTANPKEMVTEWNVSGDAGLTITLPVSGTGLNITVDWGDEAVETITTEFPTHTYAQNGVYEIAVAGNCPVWGYSGHTLPNSDLTNYYTYTQYLTKVKQLGELNASKYGFARCGKLTEVSGENLVANKTFENVTDMSNMFYFCSGLTSLDVSNFDTSKVTNMRSMFYNCSKLTSLDLSNFDTTNVKNMGYMFTFCSSLTDLNISNFETSNVTDMYGMFAYDMKLTNLDISSFKTSKVTNMLGMFLNCVSLTSVDVSNFDTSNVVNMSNLFYNCKSLTNIDVSNFDTNKVTTMAMMFFACDNLTNIDVSNFNTSNVKTMEGMFGKCTGLESIDVTKFDTSKVTDMAGMFDNCKKLSSIDVSSFNTLNVIAMVQMFSSCSGLTSLNLSNFDTSSVISINSMFAHCSNLKSIMISDKFIVSGDATDMFNNCTNLTAIITTSTTPVENQFKGQLPAGTKLYVPNGSEDAYKEILSGDTDASKIKPIIEPIGETEVGVLIGTSYEEQNYTVAGFGVEEVEYYMVYGYNVEVSGDVNTNEKGTYKVEYILTRTYKDTDGTQKEERHIATRIVKVYDAPVVNLYENNITYSGDWTNKDVVAIMNILSSKTTWIAIRVENGDWSIEPTYAKIEKSGDQMIATFNTSLNGKVYFKEVDVAGNATTYESEPSIIKIDKESPVIEEIKAETIDGVIKLKASIKEELSGIEYYAVVASGEEITWKKYEQEDSKIEETLLASGKYQLWLKDIAQNEASGEIIAKKDVEPPKGNIDIVATNIISGDKYTNQDAVLININVTDNQTEQERIMYAIYNEEDYKEVKAGTKEIEWKQYTPTVTWVLKEPQGINIIYAVFKDMAGNISMSQGILETP